ncbi:hypothetical protein HYZ97_03630 [Candidatus Pacearchaeota archaeon]|nr:hypothetical protein [Candidatus Pacearchaeota archaeon]
MINYLVPSWFFGIDSTIEALFSLITLAIAIAAFKIYALTKEQTIRRFGVGFLFIALSYVFWAGMNAVTVPGLKEQFPTVSIYQLSAASVLGFYAYMLLFITGLVLLAHTTFNTQRGAIFYLMLGPSLMVLLVSVNQIVTMRLLAIFLLSFIAFHYLTEYYRKSNRKTLLVFIGFVLLIISNIGFAFSPADSWAYVLGHIIEIGAYSLFLATLVRTLRYKPS